MPDHEGPCDVSAVFYDAVTGRPYKTCSKPHKYRSDDFPEDSFDLPLGFSWEDPSLSV